jgi:predicted HD superfamily hydrolase involved in NAD metabolism
VRLARAVHGEIGQRHRLLHTLRVARLAGRLAHAHGVDAQRARVAGLLHDLARLLPPEVLLAECARRGLAVDAFEAANPIVLHARLGAEFARERFGTDDPGILSAIRKHTVADAVMSPLDAVVYLADGLEPGRAFAERPALAALAFHDLDGAMRAVLASTLAYLTLRGLDVAPQTLAAARTYGVPVPPAARRADQKEKHPA